MGGSNPASIKSQCDIAQQEFAQFPKLKILSLLGNFLIHATLLSLAGGPTSIACGSIVQRSLLGLLALFHIGFTLFWRKRVLAGNAARELAVGITGEYRLDEKTTLYYPLLSCFAGMCAGGLGIAAGIVMGPIMLMWG